MFSRSSRNQPTPSHVAAKPALSSSNAIPFGLPATTAALFSHTFTSNPSRDMPMFSPSSSMVMSEADVNVYASMQLLAEEQARQKAQQKRQKNSEYEYSRSGEIDGSRRKPRVPGVEASVSRSTSSNSYSSAPPSRSYQSRTTSRRTNTSSNASADNKSVHSCDSKSMLVSPSGPRVSSTSSPGSGECTLARKRAAPDSDSEDSLPGGITWHAEEDSQDMDKHESVSDKHDDAMKSLADLLSTTLKVHASGSASSSPSPSSLLHYCFSFLDFQTLILCRSINQYWYSSIAKQKICWSNCQWKITNQSQIQTLLNTYTHTTSLATQQEAHVFSNFCLSNLQTVHFHTCNNLTDQFTIFLASLPSLTSLSFTQCPLLTSQALAHLTHVPPSDLRILRFSECSWLNATAMHCLWKLNTLQELCIDTCENACQNTLIEWLQLCQPKLQILTLHRSNQLISTNLLHAVAHFLYGSLHTLGMSWCSNLTPSCCAHLPAMTALTALDVSGCDQINFDCVVSIANTLSLKSISLQQCMGLDDACINYLLKRNQSIQHLNISDCIHLSEQLVVADHMVVQSALQSINLWNLPRISDRTIHALIQINPSLLQSLHTLQFHSSPLITNNTCMTLKQCVNLKKLELMDVAITDAGIEHLCHLPHLIELNVSHCSQLTNYSCQLISMARFTHTLLSLDISSCSDIGDSGLHYLAFSLTSLQHLLLSCCRQVTNAGLQHFLNSPMFQPSHYFHMDVRYCHALTHAFLTALRASRSCWQLDENSEEMERQLAAEQEEDEEHGHMHFDQHSNDSESQEDWGMRVENQQIDESSENEDDESDDDSVEEIDIDHDETM